MNICRVYTNYQSRYFVLSDRYNNGTGAVLCKISTKRRKIHLIQAPCFVIQGNSEGDIFQGLSERALIKPTDEYIDADKAVKIIYVALKKYKKQRIQNRLPEPIFSRLYFIAMQAYDEILSMCMDIRFIKQSFRTFAALPKAFAWFDQLCEIEADNRMMKKSAIVIQRAWRHALVNPNTSVCRRRLLEEFEELITYS